MPNPARRNKKKKQKREEIVLTPEEKFEQMKQLKHATCCIFNKQDEYDVYVRLVKEFEDLSKTPEGERFEGIEECMALSEECRRKAEELKSGLPEEKETVSRTVTTTAREQKNEKKKGKGRWAALGIVVLVVAAAIAYKAAPTRYWLAGVESKAGLHRYAMESYAKLGDYKESAAKEKEESVSYAEKLRADGDLDGARRQYSKLADNGDENAAVLETELEQTLIGEAKPGKTVVFGKCRWIMLEKKNGKALLTRYKVLRGGEKEIYNSSSEKVTWKDSSLRAYLNGEFFEKEFTQPEAACVEQTNLKNSDNKIYGTKGGEDTADYVFILSSEEMEPYLQLLKEKAKSIRLRTPGADQTATAYVGNTLQIIDYGYPVEQKGIYNRPAVWVKYE